MKVKLTIDIIDERDNQDDALVDIIERAIDKEPGLMVAGMGVGPADEDD